jgi:hypothetical protein
MSAVDPSVAVISLEDQLPRSAMAFRSIGRDIWDQPAPARLDLDRTGHSTDIRHQSVDFKQPYQACRLEAVGEHPAVVPLGHPERVPDGLGLVAAGTRRHAEAGAYVLKAHVRRHVLVIKDVELPERVHHAASPCRGLPRHQGAGAFAAQRGNSLSRQRGIVFVEAFAAEGIGQRRQLAIPSQHRLRHALRRAHGRPTSSAAWNAPVSACSHLRRLVRRF